MNRLTRILIIMLCCWLGVSALPICLGQELPVDEEDKRWLRRKPIIQKLAISGNDHISTSKIRQRMEMVPRSFWEKITFQSQHKIQTNAWERDRQAIVDLYKRNGYLETRVVIDIRRDEESDEAIVEVFVNEGNQTVWGDISHTGDSTIASERMYRWLDELKEGKPANPFLLRWAVGKCTETYANYGHPYAGFDVTWDIDSAVIDTADVLLEVTPNPEVAFGEIEISGNSFTKRSVVERELTFETDDRYSREEIIKSQNNIYRTGMFTFTRILIDADTAGVDTAFNTRPDFTVRVVERKPSYVDFSIGAGQSTNREDQYDLTLDYTAEWGNLNWLGTGRQWALQARSEFRNISNENLLKWSVLTHRLQGRYTEPWIFGLRLPTTLQLTYEPLVHSPIHQYRQRRISAELGIEYQYRTHNKLWVTILREDIQYVNFPEEAQEELRFEENITVANKVVLSVQRDTRPSILVPTSGSLTRLDLELAGGFLGGDANFYKAVASWARYQGVAQSIFATRFKLGIVEEHDDDSPVPTNDRFYLGGASSIRGYEENRVGPISSEGTPIGGQFYGIANIELRTPVIWNFWFTVFGDIGNNWSDVSEATYDDLLVTLGIGVQYVSPVGPLRLDYGKRVTHPEHPASDRIHLAILFAF